MAVRQTRAAESIKNFYTQEKWYKHMCSALTVNTFGRCPDALNAINLWYSRAADHVVSYHC